jgi:hypothetical protein
MIVSVHVELDRRKEEELTSLVASLGLRDFTTCTFNLRREVAVHFSRRRWRLLSTAEL